MNLFSPNNPLNNFTNFLRDESVATQLLLVKRKIINTLGKNALKVSQTFKDLLHHCSETEQQCYKWGTLLGILKGKERGYKMVEGRLKLRVLCRVH